MSPRHNRRRDDDVRGPDAAAARSGVSRVEHGPDGEWQVRLIPGSAATKTYRCPGCDHEIRAGQAHVVAWSEGAGLDYRRHWHTPCWRARDRRRPLN